MLWTRHIAFRLPPRRPRHARLVLLAAVWVASLAVVDVAHASSRSLVDVAAAEQPVDAAAVTPVAVAVTGGEAGPSGAAEAAVPPVPAVPAPPDDAASADVTARARSGGEAAKQTLERTAETAGSAQQAIVRTANDAASPVVRKAEAAVREAGAPVREARSATREPATAVVTPGARRAHAFSPRRRAASSGRSKRIATAAPLSHPGSAHVEPTFVDAVNAARHWMPLCDGRRAVACAELREAAGAAIGVLPLPAPPQPVPVFPVAVASVAGGAGSSSVGHGAVVFLLPAAVTPYERASLARARALEPPLLSIPERPG